MKVAIGFTLFLVLAAGSYFGIFHPAGNPLPCPPVCGADTK